MIEKMKRVKTRVYDMMGEDFDVDDDRLEDIIDECIVMESAKSMMPIEEKLWIHREILSSIRGLDALQELVDDDSITEIMVNGAEEIFVEKGGKIQLTGKRFESNTKLEDIAQKIAAVSNRIVNASNPIVDTRLPNGSRVNIILPPIAIDGPVITIRKFYDKPLTMERMIDIGSITGEAAQFLDKAVVNRCNIFISGGTGSGKTTFLNALSNYIPESERIITIEDSAELQIQNAKNMVRLETRNANVEGQNAVSIRDLIRASLRMRPDRIVVGEVRGEETIDMLQAMNTGHDGSLSTGHGNSPSDMLSRLEMMVLMGVEIPIDAVKQQIASAIDLLVHLGRMEDGSRKVLEIVEVTGFENGEINLNTLFKYDRKKKKLEPAGTGIKSIKKMQSASDGD